MTLNTSCVECKKPLTSFIGLTAVLPETKEKMKRDCFLLPLYKYGHFNQNLTDLRNNYRKFACWVGLVVKMRDVFLALGDLLCKIMSFFEDSDKILSLSLPDCLPGPSQSDR
jgi:hypothetical protein